MAAPVTFTSNGTYTVPSNCTAIQIECVGGGAGGGEHSSGLGNDGGGGGGAYSKINSFSVTPNATYTVNVGGGGSNDHNGGDSYFNTNTCLAKGGKTPTSVYGFPHYPGYGGLASEGIGDVKYSGGTGSVESFNGPGGGAGSGAGSSGPGNNGGIPSGGAAVANYGGKGGDGEPISESTNGYPGEAYGGGGGGNNPFYTHGIGGPGHSGFVVLTEVTSVPIVTTQAVSNISITTAIGNGNITDTGTTNVTVIGFCYKVGASGDPTTSDSTSYDDGLYDTGAYTKTITGLTPGTAYRVRAYAINSNGTSYGTTVAVTTTPPVAPTLTTDTITPHIKSIELNGTIATTGGACSRRGFCYKVGVSGTPTTSDSVIYENGFFDVGAFSQLLQSLTADTSYRFRAYATNGAGTAYGSTVQTATLVQQTGSDLINLLLNNN